MIVGPVYASVATAGTFISIPMTILPVKFVGFSVARQNNDVLVQWSTAEEVAAANYEVERSFDGTTWSKVGTLAAKGNATSLTNYSFTDRNLSSQTAYYRVKQLDIDLF